MAMQIREYHMRYLHHRKEASRAEVYLDSQVCVDARVKANLDGFHHEEAAHFVTTLGSGLVRHRRTGTSVAMEDVSYC